MKFASIANKMKRTGGKSSVERWNCNYDFNFYIEIIRLCESNKQHNVILERELYLLPIIIIIIFCPLDEQCKLRKLFVNTLDLQEQCTNVTGMCDKNISSNYLLR